MSLYFKCLPWIIPQILITATPGTEVALVSPWMADVELDCFALRSKYPEPKLSDLINWLHHRDIRSILVVRENDFRLKNLLKKLSNHKKMNKIIMVDHIHTKAVITEQLALVSSANLLDTSLYRNRENISLSKNRYNSTKTWLRFEQDI